MLYVLRRRLSELAAAGRAACGALLGLADGPGGVDQADMAECLREVADHFAAGHVDLFSQQADVVDRCHRPLKGRRGVVQLASQRLCLCQPEGAEREGSLLARQAVVSEVTGRKPVIASIRLDASRSSLPKAWVKASTRSFHPRVRMAARISSRAAAHASTWCWASSWGAMSI